MTAQIRRYNSHFSRKKSRISKVPSFYSSRAIFSKPRIWIVQDKMYGGHDPFVRPPPPVVLSLSLLSLSLSRHMTLRLRRPRGRFLHALLLPCVVVVFVGRPELELPPPPLHSTLHSSRRREREERDRECGISFGIGNRGDPEDPIPKGPEREDNCENEVRGQRSVLSSLVRVRERGGWCMRCHAEKEYSELKPEKRQTEAHCWLRNFQGRNPLRRRERKRTHTRTSEQIRYSLNVF